MKQQSKYPETLIAHACHKAYAALRKHYGPDPNDLKNPCGVEQAIRRDVIAVLDGATAKDVHESWCSEKFNRSDKSYGYDQMLSDNPTLNLWRDIPDHDKVGYRLFCAKVHEARREHDKAQGVGTDMAKFPRTFELAGGKCMTNPVAYKHNPKLVDELDAFLDAKKNKERELERLRYCGNVASTVFNAYVSQLGMKDACIVEYALDGIAVILRDPSAPTLFADVMRRSGRNSVWHQSSKRVQSAYTVFVAALVAAAEHYDIDN